MTRLFIQNQEVELDKSVQFAITKQFEDLSNPTIIINDWSKTVSIPFTQKNNNLFGHIYNADRLIAEGGDSITGIYFNPYKKLDFRLQWGDSVLMVGYAKMNNVKQNNGKGTYEITLFGELGKIFQELKKITFDTTTTEPDYLISGDTWVDERINRNLVYSSWNSSGQTHSELLEKTDSGYTVTDIIGFAPNNSFGENFKYDTFQVGDKESRTFEDVLGTGFTEDTGIEPKTVIPDGMLPREIGEYRSYMQLPFIYWNKLFKIFQTKAESITGYRFELDSSWFNTSNPYWYNLTYMLNPFNTEKTDGTTNYYPFYYELGNLRWAAKTSDWRGVKTTDLGSYETTESVPLINAFRVLPARFTTSDDYSLLCSLFLNLRLQVQMNGENEIRLSNANALRLTLNLVNGSNTVIRSYKILVYSYGDFWKETDNYDDIIKIDTAATPLSTYYDAFYINSQMNFNVSKNDFSDSVGFQLQADWLTFAAPFISGGELYNPQNSATILACTTSQSLSIQIDKRKKSNSKFVLNDLWNNDYNLFDEIIRYCKMYRISISVDELNKKIVFKPFYKYFENYTVEDWTNIVDKSKDYTITPITFENKYVLFDYKDSETQLGKDYKERWGVNYGEYRLITGYNFNTETKKLFENVSQSIVNTDNVLSWTSIYDKHIIAYSFPAEIYVYNKDKDNKQKNIFGSYFFHNGLANFSTESGLNLRSVKISDDTTFQQDNNNYFYSQGGGSLTNVTTFPKLDIINGDNMCVFNIPKENYTYLNNYSNKNTIYSNFWEKYINERYNIQNKKITCYVRLNPTEYQSFDWNHFIKIGNQLCIVNKIYDYDITSNQSTKVDLITIQNLEGYTTDRFV